MSNVETGNLIQLAYIQELLLGTTPATPAGQILRFVPPLSFGAEADYIDNPELRTDGMKAAGRRGSLRGKASVAGKLSYGTYDPFIAAVLGNFDWNSNVVKVKALKTTGAIAVAVDSSAKTFTRSGGDFTTDFAVGDYVSWSGFTNAGNNGTFKISTLTANVMTCVTATGLVTEGSASGRICIINIRPSFTFEKSHKMNGIFFPFLGCVVDSLSFSGKVKEAIDFDMSLLTKSVGSMATTTLFSSIVQPNTNDLMTSFEGSLKIGGTTIANVTSWDLKFNRNCDIAEVCGSADLYDIQPKALEVSGSLEMYFNNGQSYTDYQNNNDLALQINLGTGGTKLYSIDLTKCRYKNWKDNSKDGMCTVSVDFESYAPNSGTNTSAMVTRTP